MLKHSKLFISVIALTALLILPYFVFAQGQTGGSESMLGKLKLVADGGGYAVGEGSSLMVVVGTIIQAALSLLGAIFIIIMVIAGYRWMTASGNEKSIENAQNMIRRAIIGLVITLSSYAIWTFIFDNFINK